MLNFTKSPNGLKTLVYQGFVRWGFFVFGIKKRKDRYIFSIKYIGSVSVERGKKRNNFTKGITKTNDKVFSKNLYTEDSGIVCSVRIYDKSLSAADVQRNYLIDASRFGS